MNANIHCLLIIQIENYKANDSYKRKQQSILKDHTYLLTKVNDIYEAFEKRYRCLDYLT